MRNKAFSKELLLCLCLIGFSLLAIAQQNDEVRWPRELESSQGQIILYQPQPQQLKGNHVIGTAAFSITPSGKNTPFFGALFFDAVLDIDREEDLYTVLSASFPNIKFSSSDSSLSEEKLRADIAEAVPGWGLSGSVDELITTISEVSNTSSGTEAFRNDAPDIIFTKQNSVLVTIDGEPRLQPLEGSSVRRVVNSPFLILKSDTDGKFYLYGGDSWFSAESIKGMWMLTQKVPVAVRDVVKVNQEQAGQAERIESNAAGEAPQIIVSTQPAELIQTNGEPNFISIPNTSLLYVKNSDDGIFRDINSQQYYILKSGRWYSSASLDKGWSYVPADKIPADFAKIEPGSEHDFVLASVPGTTESRDALLDAQVPQTATVNRKTAGRDVKVEYDGTPDFETIEGTSMQLAVNASKTVMKAGGRYYLVDNGVWFESASYNGPWEVSTSRPSEVDRIPPSSAAYNTRYVYIYDHTPEVVYVGYTPGYCGAYIYGPTVVYGTGWYYRPWVGTVYYPRPWTWGFNMHYNPWSGWSIGFGFSNGPWHFGFGSYGYGWSSWGGGWFGPPVFYPPVWRPYPSYGYNRPGYYGPRPGTNRPAGNSRPPQARPRPGTRENLYNRPQGNTGISSGIRNRDALRLANPQGRPTSPSARPVTRPAVSPSARPSSAPATRPNNVYTDRDGNVYRRDQKGNWEQNRNNQWNKVDPGANRVPDLNRDQFNRDRGNNRYNNNPVTRPNYSPAPATRPSYNTHPAPRPSYNTRPAPRPAAPSRPAPRPMPRGR